jgi:serine phosphatase RsbU (regulator of sigma subunit)
VKIDALARRALIAAFAIRLADLVAGSALGRVPTALSVIDTIAAVVIAAAALYFLARGLSAVRRRLLWRVRRKLVISYIFVGLIPALLLTAFFVIGGILLFYNFSAYLARSEFARVRAAAAGIAQLTATELERAGELDVAGITERRRAAASAAFPGLSVSALPLTPTCRNPQLPDWIGCRDFSGLLKAPPFVQRAVAFPGAGNPAYAAVVDVPLTDAFTRSVRDTTGIEVGLEPPTEASPPLTSFAYLERVDWTTGDSETFQLSIRLGIGEMYDKISAGPGLDGTRNVVIILLALVGGLFLILQIVALWAGLGLARSITGSVHELFVGTERVAQEDFMHKIAVTGDDQLGELARSFNKMTGRIEDLLYQKREKERLEQELRIAHDIQMSLLPQGPLEMPGISLTAVCVPAREVGGDYYDFFVLDENRLGVLIADVSGKGTSAALYMAELKGLVLSLSRIHRSPRELLVQANRLIAEHLDSRSFITMTYAIVDLPARTMTYARAGHTPLIYLPGSAGSAPAQVLTPDGLVLGLKLDGGETFDRLLEEDTIALGPGDLYFFFTDGISEAMNEQDDFFGERRLAALIEQHAHLPAQELRERVFREVKAFTGNAAQHDDMTMILLKVDQVGSVSRPSEAEVAVVD